MMKDITEYFTGMLCYFIPFAILDIIFILIAYIAGLYVPLTCKKIAWIMPTIIITCIFAASLSLNGEKHLLNLIFNYPLIFSWILFMMVYYLRVSHTYIKK